MTIELRKWGKYITTSVHNKFTSDVLDAKIKEKRLVNKSGISNLIKNSDLNTIQRWQQKQN